MKRRREWIRKRIPTKLEVILSKRVPSHKQVLDAKEVLRNTRSKTGPEIQAEARRYASAALKCLKQIVGNPISNDVARISAAQTLLDRGYGRPTQTNVNATVNTDGKPTEITDQELNRRVTETLSRIEGLTKRKREKITGEERPTDIRKYN